MAKWDIQKLGTRIIHVNAEEALVPPTDGLDSLLTSNYSPMIAPPHLLLLYEHLRTHSVHHHTQMIQSPLSILVLLITMKKNYLQVENSTKDHPCLHLVAGSRYSPGFRRDHQEVVDVRKHPEPLFIPHHHGVMMT